MIEFFLAICIGLSAVAETNLGFFNANSPEVPRGVKEARGKIFKISMPYYITVSETQFDSVLANDSSSPEAKRTIQKCKDLSRTTCMLPNGRINGTAFLDESPNYVWTNCHIVRQWMEYYAQDQVFSRSQQVREFFSSANIPLVLRDSDRNILYAADRFASLKAFAPEIFYDRVGGACSSQDDLVKIKLEEPFSHQGLRWSRSNSSGQLFIGGYPRLTDSRKSIRKSDSDGESFYWTFGPSMNFRDPKDLMFLSKMPHLEFVLGGTYSGGVLSDGVEGMSGGPVLNSEGEVEGIYKGFVPQSAKEGGLPFLSLYIKNEGMRFIEILSGE